MMWKIFGKRRSYARNLKIVRNWNFCHIIDWGFMHTGSWEETINLEEHASMSRWDVYQKMEFLCETDWTFDIAISGLEVYKAGIGKTGVTEEVLKA